MIKGDAEVGDMVHYVAYGTPNQEFPSGVCRAAVVTQVHRSSPIFPSPVGLCVLNPTGQFFNPDISYDGSAAPKPGTWHFKERHHDNPS
jgi:hypothetical protein